MTWNTDTLGYPFSSSAFLTATLVNAMIGDQRTLGGNLDCGGNALTNCAAVYGPTGAAAMALFTNAVQRVNIAGNGRTALYAGSEPYALNLSYQVGDTPFFLGAAHTSGDLIFSDVGGVERMRLTQAGKLGIGRTPTAKFAVVLATFASNALAISGGLSAGDFYTDGSGAVKVVF